MDNVVSGRPAYFSALTLEFLGLAPKEIGFAGGSDGKESACNAGDPVPSLDQEDALEKRMTTHSSILAWRTP